MQDCYKKLEEIFGLLNSVCDANGIVRVLTLSQMYCSIKELHTSMMNAETEWKHEKLKLEAEIKDLKELLGKE